MPSTLVIEELSLAEKLKIMEQLWDSLCRQPHDVPVPDWHDVVLKERERRVEQGVSQFTDWKDAKDSIRAAVKNGH